MCQRQMVLPKLRHKPREIQMIAYQTRSADPTKILLRREIAVVIDDLKRKAARSPSTRLNLIVFRLATCCGLRASEIAHLQLADVRLEASRPHIRIRAGAAKGGKPRTVPLWWDAGTIEDLKAWKADRKDVPCSPFVAPLHANKPFSRHTLRKRYRTACRVLGRERLETLTIHHGRHTFISHALAFGRTLAEVRDAVGHANVSITSAYLHIAVEDETVGQLFGG